MRVPHGTGANQAVRLNSSGQIPAIDATPTTGVVKSPVAPYIVPGGVLVGGRQGFVDEFTSGTLDPIWTPFGVGGGRTITPTVNGLVLADTVGDLVYTGVSSTVTFDGMRRHQFKYACKFTIPATGQIGGGVQGVGGKYVFFKHYYVGGAWRLQLFSWATLIAQLEPAAAELHACYTFDPLDGSTRLSYRVLAYDADSGWPGDTAGWVPVGTYGTALVTSLPIAPYILVQSRATAGVPMSVTLRGLKLRYI